MLGLDPAVASTGRQPLPDYAGGVKQLRFSPYQENHGSLVAIAGKDYALIASDTRLSGYGYSIHTRDQPKLFKITPKVILGSTGCWADANTFASQLLVRRNLYKFDHNKDLEVNACAQLVSVMLYAKRFFPYYVGTILAGLDENGRGTLYEYDPVGHKGKGAHCARGSSVCLLQPLLDNQIDNIGGAAGQDTVDFSLEKAINLVHDLFVSAAEREIHTGDAIAFRIITKDGIEERTVALRRD